MDKDSSKYPKKAKLRQKWIHQRKRKKKLVEISLRFEVKTKNLMVKAKHVRSS